MERRRTTPYISDTRPDFTPFEIDCGRIPGYRYKRSVAGELAHGELGSSASVGLLEDMYMIREMEEMIVKLRSGAYEPIAGFNYGGPTHVSIGQEGPSVGVASSLTLRGVFPFVQTTLPTRQG
jgi:hypothetical protein